jgi:hypothetical protein
MRFQLDWTEPRAFRAQVEPRSSGMVNWARVGCGSSVFIAVLLYSVGHTVAQGDFSPDALKMTFSAAALVVGIIALMVLQSVASRSFSYQVDIGPKGVSRMQPSSLFRIRLRPGQTDTHGTIPWHDIQEIAYQEHFPLGRQCWRVLIVHKVTGDREMVAIAEGVPRERIAKTLEAWGKQLVDAPSTSSDDQPPSHH